MRMKMDDRECEKETRTKHQLEGGYNKLLSHAFKQNQRLESQKRRDTKIWSQII